MSEEIKITGNQLQIENTVYQLDYKVLGYITNLQQKVKLLTTGLEATDKAYKDYKSRCKRAIEIIDMNGCYDSITEDKLYSCLRGGNKNENSNIR